MPMRILAVTGISKSREALARRAAIAAAGGLVNAPYLKDDLRVTLLSGIFTLLSIPLGVFFTFVAFLTLVF